MKSKLIVFVLIAGSSAFAQTRFSFSIGSSGSGYYAPRPEYYAQRAYPAPSGAHVYGALPGWVGAGYWGEDPDRQHRRTEWYGLHNHQEGERYLYGDSPELRDHQAQERWQLRHEQWHERNGDYDAAGGPAHGSARDGLYQGHHH